MTRQVPYPHPGEILVEEFLSPMGITPYKLAQAIHVPLTRITAIIAGERGITADTGLRLSRAFGLSDEFWMNLQRDYDAATTRDALHDELDDIEPLTYMVYVSNADGCSAKQVDAAQKRYILVLSHRLGGTQKVPEFYASWSKCLREGKRALTDAERRQVKTWDAAAQDAEAAAKELLGKVSSPSFLVTLRDGSVKH
ncbi:HigA family addiction module antitoxin [Variovorax paradoxus]|jgi:addiction module HigA family antidote|uniref:HigA family addiction module antitoxin n=1 Tax=Variovorax paradoxus TaxID=34073 RepID=UPI00037A6FFA|nr:HigA family addiction module antitoxin [Variovorax paradoxus]WPH15323.1 HigA family addiction module antitoxin [Variovorax paradoxus]